MNTVTIKPGMILSFAGGRRIIIVKTVYNDSIVFVKYDSFVGTFVTRFISVSDISSGMFKVIDI